MMSNMFFIFDPNTNMFMQSNWISIFFNLLIMPPSFWIFKSRFYNLNKIMIMNLYKEMKLILKLKFNYLNSLYFINIFMIIFFNNFMGMFPYIFTSTSHLIFAFSFSLPLWISLMLFSWIKMNKKSFAHLIPQSTPFILMPFMVMIETISNFIRPLTLSIRLTANMIAGHLLLTLLSQSAISNNIIITLNTCLIQIILLVLEFSVTIIQSYVYSMLMILYMKEASHIS